MARYATPVVMLLALAAVITAPDRTRADAAVRNVRIVDFGADMCGFVYNPYRNLAPYQVRGLEPFLDKDGNGTLDNDTVSGWPFSLSEPLSFPFAPFYDLRQKSARLYGGVMTYAVNNPERYVSEGMMNANHESRDDFNFMGLGAGKPIPADELLEAYGLWLWQKDDFLNDGDRHAVAFAPDSYIAVHVSRYWGGFHAGRWVVREGEQFYVSEKTFGDKDELIDGAAVRDRYAKRNPMTHRTYILRPGESRWARYEPRESEPGRHATMDFDADAATFEPRRFDDITAVGFLVIRRLSPATRAVWDNLSVHQTLALKWYAFRCDAVVRRPQRGGYVVEMAPAAGGLLLGVRPVSFAQWERIRRIGVTNQYCPGLGELGYAIRCDGAMGAMEADGRSHTAAEPVGAITWLDAVAWCNMLSEYEGLSPAYYADAACTEVLRRVVNRNQRELWGSAPTVYWRQGAEGFRLPTRAESPGEDVLCWEGPSAGALLRVARNPADAPDGAVVFRQPSWPDLADLAADPDTLAAEARAEAERLQRVRLPVGMASAEDGDPFGVFATQTVIREARNDRFRGLISEEQLAQVTRENSPPDYAGRPTYDLEVGATEVPYRTWIAVRRWAQRQGYSFNYAGDMGSMRCLFDEGHAFSPDEPVTNITWHDALVWCNALSELTGRRCAYYLDAEYTQPYRQALTFRLDTFHGPGYPALPAEVLEAMGHSAPADRPADSNSATRIYLDADADGYRLPFVQEFDRLGPDAGHADAATLAGQALAVEGGAPRTGPVDAGQPDARGLYELHGNVLEWAWSPLDSYLDVMGKYPLNGYGCFSMTVRQTAENTRRYQDATYSTRPYFGFRIVRRAK